MIGQEMVNRLYDCEVVDPRGEKIGSVKRVWLDGQTGDPLWASVHTGFLGMKESFVPLQRAELREDQLRVPVQKEQVKESPRIEAAGDQMTEEEQTALYRHYGVAQQNRGTDGRVRRPGTTQQPGDYPARGRDDDAMTRSEERLRVGTRQTEAGRVRLVKHVVTEQQQMTVPVSHEEVRVEREPITEANRDAATRGPNISEAEHEVTLHAEQPVVEKETVPVERVRLGTETVTEQQTVSDTVRKEQIDVRDGRHERSERPERRG